MGQYLREYPADGSYVAEFLWNKKLIRMSRDSHSDTIELSGIPTVTLLTFMATTISFKLPKDICSDFTNMDRTGWRY